MKIYIANEAKPQQGGGFSFMSHFVAGAGEMVTESYKDSDIFFVPGASMIKPEQAEQAKMDGKKVVLRVDNALKHSRNRGKGMSRMHRIASISDAVIYQCQWAKDYLDDFLEHPPSYIVYNGTDTDIFKPSGEKIDFGTNDVYLYAAASKGDNKGWERAWHHYQKVQQSNPNAILLIAGRVPTDVINNNFDFFQNERYHYLGMISSPHDMARIYRSAKYFYAVAEFDCYSNALLESLACGLEPIEVSLTGGTPELMHNWYENGGKEYNNIDRMIRDYKSVFNRIL